MAAETEAESQYLNVLSAFLAIEPVDSVITLARGCTGGSITENAQRFFWEICVEAVSKFYSFENSEKCGSFKIFVVKLLIWDLLVFAKLNLEL
jgi:hypothetical protein